MLKNNQEDIVFLPSAVAFHIRNSLRDASQKHRYRDVRSKVSESQPEPQIIQDFLDRQPALAGDDWDALAGQAPRLVKGCEVHAFKDAIFFGFMITDDIYAIFRLHPAISFYLTEMIDEAEQTGRLLNLGKTHPPVVFNKTVCTMIDV
jgi:hypothetical protein